MSHVDARRLTRRVRNRRAFIVETAKAKQLLGERILQMDFAQMIGASFPTVNGDFQWLKFQGWVPGQDFTFSGYAPERTAEFAEDFRRSLGEPTFWGEVGGDAPGRVEFEDVVDAEIPPDDAQDSITGDLVRADVAASSLIEIVNELAAILPVDSITRGDLAGLIGNRISLALFSLRKLGLAMGLNVNSALEFAKAELDVDPVYAVRARALYQAVGNGEDLRQFAAAVNVSAETAQEWVRLVQALPVERRGLDAFGVPHV